MTGPYFSNEEWTEKLKNTKIGKGMTFRETWEKLTDALVYGFITGGFITTTSLILNSKKDYRNYWDKSNGCCSYCGAPLNEYMIGGYKLHDGTFGVSAASNKSTGKEIIRAYKEYLERQSK